MSAALFLAGFLWTLCGVCTVLTVLTRAGVLQWCHLRNVTLLVVLALAGASMRGQSWGWAGWLPMAAAVWLTYRSVRFAVRWARIVRLAQSAVRSRLGSPDVRRAERRTRPPVRRSPSRLREARSTSHP